MMARALGLLAVTSVYAFTHDESAACYASRYPDLGARFCTTDRCDTHALHDHYKNLGATEKRRWGCGSPAMDAAKYDVAAGQRPWPSNLPRPRIRPPQVWVGLMYIFMFLYLFLERAGNPLYFAMMGRGFQGRLGGLAACKTLASMP